VTASGIGVRQPSSVAGASGARHSEDVGVVKKEDSAQQKWAPTEARRMRVVRFVHQQADDGRLSTRERDERIERIFRAGSAAELDSVVADLPGASVLSLDAAIAGETWQKPARENAWFRRLVIYTLIVSAVGVAIWALTGGGLVWLVLLFMMSAAVFAFRVARRGKGVPLGRSPRRAR
jgi:hypothetical protein